MTPKQILKNNFQLHSKEHAVYLGKFNAKKVFAGLKSNIEKTAFAIENGTKIKVVLQSHGERGIIMDDFEKGWTNEFIKEMNKKEWNVTNLVKDGGRFICEIYA